MAVIVHSAASFYTAYVAEELLATGEACYLMTSLRRFSEVLGISWNRLEYIERPWPGRCRACVGRRLQQPTNFGDRVFFPGGIPIGVQASRILVNELNNHSSLSCGAPRYVGGRKRQQSKGEKSLSIFPPTQHP